MKKRTENMMKKKFHVHLIHVQYVWRASMRFPRVPGEIRGKACRGFGVRKASDVSQ